MRNEVVAHYCGTRQRIEVHVVSCTKHAAQTVNKPLNAQSVSLTIRSIASITTPVGPQLVCIF